MSTHGSRQGLQSVAPVGAEKQDDAYFGVVPLNREAQKHPKILYVQAGKPPIPGMKNSFPGLGVQHPYFKVTLFHKAARLDRDGRCVKLILSFISTA